MAAEPWVVPAPDVSTFGKRLAYVRWYQGLSREAFVRQLDLDVTQGSLANWENEKACDTKAEVAAAIEREWPDFPAIWVLYGRGLLGGGPDPAPKATTRKNVRSNTPKVKDTPSYRAPYVTMGKCAGSSLSDLTVDAHAEPSAA